MPITAQIDQGSLPSYDLVDETGILVKSLEWKATRKYVERTNADEEVIWHSARSPRLEGTIKGPAVPAAGGALEGLAAIHPGVATTIANFASGKTIHGFAWVSGTKVIVKDVTQSLSDEKEAEFDIPVVFLPKITTFSSATS